jgi:hypothetical protein
LSEYTSNLVTGIIFMVLIVAGGMAIIGQFRASDSTFATGTEVSAFNNSFHRTEEITNLSTGLQARLKEAPSETPLGFLDTLGMGIIGALKSISTSITFFTDSLSGLSMFGVPAWIPGIFIALVLIGLFFAIGGGILGRDL